MNQDRAKFVIASFEIDCLDNHPPPVYRLWLSEYNGRKNVPASFDEGRTICNTNHTKFYDIIPDVNHHLFAERCFDFRELWLEESLQILAPPGEYLLRIEPLNKSINKFRFWNFHVDKGPAVFQPREDHTSAEIVLEVHDESP